MVPCKTSAKEVSFEWSHYEISSTDSKVRTLLYVFIVDSGTERGDNYCAHSRVLSCGDCLLLCYNF